MIILGIDPGSRKAGVSLIKINGSAMMPIYHQTLMIAAEPSISDRFKRLHNLLNDIIDTYQPTQAAIESVFLSKNANSALKLGQARGAIILTLGLKGLTAHDYAPRLIKSAVTGSGSAQKAQVQFMIERLLNISNLKEDEADAYAVAICHYHHYRIRLLQEKMS